MVKNPSTSDPVHINILSELYGTEWLHPPGASSTERCFTEMETGFLILTGSNRIVRKIKDFLDMG